MVNLADCLVKLLQGHSFEEVVPVKYSSWKNWKIVVISHASYQPVGQRVIMSRGLQVGLESQKWGWQLDYE